MDLNNDQDLDVQINILNDTKENQQFLRSLKAVMEYCNLFDLANTEKRIFKNVLPRINHRFTMIYNDNFTIFETLEDEMICILKENLEVAFELIESLQEILNLVYRYSPVSVNDIESVLKYIPKSVLLFAEHWKNSSETYKNKFNAEISQLSEVIKHLFVSFLNIIEFSLNLEDNSDEVSLLAGALTLICELPKAFYILDTSSAVSTWKCFSGVTAKYSATLENCIDLQIPINILCEDIHKILETLIYDDVDDFRRQIKLINFLIKILLKISDIFYQQLDTFSLELLIFYIKILSLSMDHFKSRQFSTDALSVLESEVFEILDVFLNHLIMGQSNFKDHLEKISNYIENMVVFKKYPFGVINLLSKILHVITTTDSEWSVLTLKLIEAVFVTLSLCHKEYFSNVHDEELFQRLIVNMSAAILLQDATFESREILLRHVLQENVYVAVVALEVYTLIVSNLPSEECVSLLINLLYGVNDLRYGFFTNRPEMVYLKILVQRIFKILPNTFKDEIIKLFSPDQHIQIWRFLGFSSLPVHQVQLLINPLIKNTAECVGSSADNFSEDILNIAEGLDLLSTVNNLDTNEPRFNEITKFLHTFWASDCNSVEILDNNLMKYFILRIAGITSICIEHSSLDIQLVSTKLKTLSSQESYWVAVYKIIHSILNSIPLINIPYVIKQRILSQITEIINLPLQNKNNLLLKETYLELFKNLNKSQKDILNLLLDNLNPNVANQVFEYLENSSGKVSIIDYKHYSKMSFTHKCINWKAHINITTLPEAKRAKMEIPFQPLKIQNSIEKNSTIPFINKTRKIGNQDKTKTNRENFSISHDTDEDSSVSEVIERIKGEVKCLIKTCKTDKLTQKNVTDLKILMSQMSSLM